MHHQVDMNGGITSAQRLATNRRIFLEKLGIGFAHVIAQAAAEAAERTFLG
jgi:hypothetical protein